MLVLPLSTKSMPICARSAPTRLGLSLITWPSILRVLLVPPVAAQVVIRQATALKLLRNPNVLAKYPTVHVIRFTPRVWILLHPRTLKPPRLPPSPLLLGAVVPEEENSDPKKPFTTQP